jgi:hypothetical protein
MDHLLDRWTEIYDEMMEGSAHLRDLLDNVRQQLSALEEPYRVQLEAINAEIRPLAEALGKTYATDTAKVSFRKGATRITYDWRKVDSVRDFLRDVLPETASSLEMARKESVSAPSINIERL